MRCFVVVCTYIRSRGEDPKGAVGAGGAVGAVGAGFFPVSHVKPFVVKPVFKSREFPPAVSALQRRET